MRAGIVPLAIEVGLFKNTLRGKRLCKLCAVGEVESKSLFFLCTGQIMMI